MDHGGREVARELDRRAELGLARQGAAVEERVRPEIGAVQRVAAPAERGILAGAPCVAVDACHALEAGGIAGGCARTIDHGTVARDPPRFGGSGTSARVFCGLAGHRQAPEPGDGPAGAFARTARAHGLGLGRLAFDLRLQPGLRVERPGHRLGALGDVAGKLARLQAKRLDDGAFHFIDLTGEIPDDPRCLTAIVVGAVAGMGVHFSRHRDRARHQHGQCDRAKP